MNILFYDNAKSAHLIDFCNYLIESITQSEKGHDDYFYFYLNSRVYSDLISLNKFNVELLKSEYNVYIEPIQMELRKNIFFKNGQLNELLNSINELLYLNKIIRGLKINNLFFLQIDLYQFSVGFLGLIFPKYLKISGILFTPYTLYPDFFSFARFKKFFQSRVLMLNNSVTKIFILNDYKSVNLMNEKFKSAVFNFLPDPIGSSNNNSENNINPYQNDGVLKFLILGNISPRKNLVNIIQAFNLLSEDEISNVELNICGKFNSSDYFNEVVSKISDKISGKISITNSFHDENYFNIILDQVDVIFVAYINFFASSGILGNAARNNKLVIGTKNGIIGSVISEYSLGLTINPESPLEILYAIKKVIQERDSLIREAKFNEYCDANNYRVFSTKILELKW